MPVKQQWAAFPSQSRNRKDKQVDGIALVACLKQADGVVLVVCLKDSWKSFHLLMFLASSSSARNVVWIDSYCLITTHWAQGECTGDLSRAANWGSRKEILFKKEQLVPRKAISKPDPRRRYVQDTRSLMPGNLSVKASMCRAMDRTATVWNHIKKVQRVTFLIQCFPYWKTGS